MQYRTLGRTNIKVSELCLGTMTWGTQNNQNEAFEQLDMALDYGVNFIDTAEMYAVPPSKESYGSTEAILGNWISRRGSRDNIILASKVAGPADWLNYVRDGQPRLNAANIKKAIEGSLKRLQTDYLDLYQLHWPDRNTNYFGLLGYKHINSTKEQQTPIEDTIAALEDLVDAGKIKHFGLSNETPWGAMKYLNHAEQGSLRPASIQNPYNLLNRTYEIGLSEISHREDIGLLAYSPLAFGVLSGKYLNGARPKGARISLFSRFSRYTNPQAEAATEKYHQLAKKHDIDATQMALQFVTSRPFVTSNIIGATSSQQLKTNLESINLNLNQEILKEIDEIHTEICNPAP